jgi:hypothetical protein
MMMAGVTVAVTAVAVTAVAVTAAATETAMATVRAVKVLPARMPLIPRLARLPLLAALLAPAPALRALALEILAKVAPALERAV